MKKLFFLLCLLFPFVIISAQEEQEQQIDVGASQKFRVSSNSLYGKLIDLNSGKSIEAASVQLYPVDKKKKESLLDGMLTKANGEFRFTDLPSENSFRLVISALGYEEWEKIIQIYEQKGDTKNSNRGNARFGLRNFQKDLGNISLEAKFTELQNLTVSTSKPALEMGIDRKIFNVDKSILSAGGTAVDIMKNIPSVSVDIEGNVELRNSTPQIFVDGRPTILTLDQIPADHIDKIELITNPSAKFDASSSGGIINVVLKKNKRIGLNGIAALSAGTPDLFSSNLNLNLRQGKFNFFLSAGHNQSGGEAKGRTLRENKNNGAITDYFNQLTINNRNRNFNSLRFGSDIFLNNRNTVTISQNFVKGRFGNDEVQEQEYLGSNRALIYYGERTSDDLSEFVRKSTRINFKHNFPKDGQELTADINYNYGTRSSNSEIFNLYFDPTGREYKTPANVLNNGNSNEKQWTFQADYSNPLTENIKIETGVRSYRNKFISYYDAFAINNGQQVKLPLSNNYAYTDMTNAAYFTYSYKKENFSYQLGLRAEHSKFDGELVDSSFKFGYQYPNKIKNIWDALFPSFFITQKINDDNEIQLNYTRRIRRPRFWQLNPFIDINDPANLRQGNPQLEPEFVNSFEFNYSKNYKSGNILSVLYFRSNPRDITQYSDTITAAQYQQLNNAAVDPNAILNTYINASTTNRYGAEFTVQHKVGKNFEITPTINLQYRTVNAKINNLDLSNEGFNWEAKLIWNYKIETIKNSFFNNMGFQLIADYESPQVIPQGKRLSEFDVDAAIRKDFLKDKKASITFAVNDVFNSRRWGTIYDTERFYQDSFRRWRVRTFRLTINFKFGDTEFNLFRGGNRSGGNMEE